MATKLLKRGVAELIADFTAPGPAPDDFAVPSDLVIQDLLWQTETTGTPATVTVALQARIHADAAYRDLDSSTSITGEVKPKAGGAGAEWLRANLAALTGGTTPHVKVWVMVK